MNRADEFEDDGASFRVRRERQLARMEHDGAARDYEERFGSDPFRLIRVALIPVKIAAVTFLGILARVLLRVLFT